MSRSDCAFRRVRSIELSPEIAPRCPPSSRRADWRLKKQCCKYISHTAPPEDPLLVNGLDETLIWISLPRRKRHTVPAEGVRAACFFATAESSLVHIVVAHTAVAASSQRLNIFGHKRPSIRRAVHLRAAMNLKPIVARWRHTFG